MNFKRYHVSKNLFDITAATSGKYVRDTDGTLGNYADTSATDYIDVSGISTLYPQYFTDERPERQWAAFYNSSKTFVSGFSGYNQAITVPNDATYVRLTVDNSYISNFTVSSTELESYEPYSSEVWHDTPHYIMGTDTDTITTLPADIYANSTTATVGLKGQMEQTGTPTPSSPIQPQECGERTGNLFDSDVLLEAVGWKKNDNIYSGYSNALHNKFNSFDKCIPVDAAFVSMNIMFKYANLNTSLFIVFWYTDGTSTSSSKNAKAGEWTYFSAKSDSNKILKGIGFSYGTNDLVELKEIMLNSGSEALPYEPYGYKIPILSAGQTTPVYLGEVETTRKIKKYVFTGEENGTIYSTATSRKGIEITGITGIIGGTADIAILAICTHYQPNTRTDLYRNTDNGISNAYQNDRIIFYDASCQTVEAFQQFCAQQYAAGTPVTVWYVLTEPETGIVNEPIRKIGTYADEISGITIPTIAGANTIDIDTTLKPSEVTVNYKGWHPVADVHKRESGAWT